jgi:hypothetical protein
VSSGNDYQKAGISAPALRRGRTLRRRHDDYGVEAAAGFSKSAPVLDLLAPGDLITAAVPGGRYASLRGTSMAAPHVAGAVAALRSRMPSASADAIEQALEATGKAVADPGNGLAKPRINVHAALGALGGSTGWRPWAGRGGALAAFPECEAAGARTDCWAPGAGGSLLWNRTEDGNAWSGWADLGGSVEATPECVVAAGGGRIDCFATTTAKRLAQITFDGTAWGGWVDRGGSVTGRPSCVPAAASGPALDCFATGTDKALWRLAFDGTAWKPWQKVGGGATTTLRPECVRRDAHVECFVVDGSKRLKVRRLTGGSWASWRTLGSGFGFVPHCLVSGSKMDCFAQSADHQLLAGYFDGKNWATWRKLGGDVRTQPYCNRLSTGFECYATTAAGALVRRAREGSSWRAWENLGGAVQQRPTCIARNGGARVDCLARGLDNNLQQRSYY